MEMARLIAQMPVKPKRSMLFIALTGEEKGLRGSGYFATYPTVPASSIVACVNFDLPILTYDFSNVVAFGAEHSNLKQITATAAAELGLALGPDPEPEPGNFTRSDHFNFVRQGVPCIYLNPGTESFAKNENVRELIGSFRRDHYHQPSDDMKLPINWAAAERFAQLNYVLGVAIANSPTPIRWNPGDFFGDLFGN